MREEYWHIIAASGSVSLLTIIQTGRAGAHSCPAQPKHCSDLEWRCEVKVVVMMEV